MIRRTTLATVWAVAVAVLVVTFVGCVEPSQHVRAEVEMANGPDELLDPEDIVAAHIGRFRVVGRVLLTDGKRSLIRLPENSLDAETLAVTVDIRDRFFLADTELLRDGESVATLTDSFCMIPDGVGTGGQIGDTRYFLSFDAAEKVGIDQIRVTLKYGTYTVEEGEKFLQAVAAQSEARSHESDSDLVQHNLRVMSDQIRRPSTAGRLVTDGGDSLDAILLEDPFDPNGGRYGLEAGPGYYVLSSVGPDGIAKTDDDPLFFYMATPGGSFSSNHLRGGLWDDEAETWIPLMSRDG